MSESPSKLEDIPFKSQLVPEKLLNTSPFQFRCHKGISCFNECCKSIDITLTPYDIIRLKQAMKIDSRQFLATYTVPFEMDGHAMPGVKIKTADESKQCPFLTEAGCGVYENRPTACRYYALGLMSMREMNSNRDDDYYFTVKEEHCRGHEENQTQTVQEYRESQGVVEYDDINREWRQLILKKRSSGPTIGKPSPRSSQMFFMGCYNLDSFREFVASEGFQKVYDLDESFYQDVRDDDVKLLKFAFRLLKQVLFGEQTIKMKADAVKKRVEARQEQMASRQQADQANDFETRFDATEV